MLQLLVVANRYPLRKGLSISYFIPHEGVDRSFFVSRADSCDVNKVIIRNSSNTSNNLLVSFLLQVKKNAGYLNLDLAYFTHLVGFKNQYDAGFEQTQQVLVVVRNACLLDPCVKGSGEQVVS